MPRFRENTEVVAEAIKENGEALKYASHEVCRLQEIVEIVLKRRPEDFKHVMSKKRVLDFCKRMV